MRAYNAATVIRQSSRDMLNAFFSHEHCLDFINFEKDRLYEIQNAFMLLPDQKLHKLEVIMRNVFTFCSNECTMPRIIDEIRQYYGADAEQFVYELVHLKRRYDKGFYVYLNCPEIWERACVFSQSDNLPSRFWTHRAYLPQRNPAHDAKTNHEFGGKISEYLWKKQVRGKKFIVEYQARSTSLHYYFVYLSDYANSYETWSENSCELENHSESRTINMVFAYDSAHGTLDTYNLGGYEITANLQKIFCEVFLEHELDTEAIYKSVYELDPLLKKENILQPIPDLGIKRVKLLCLDLSYLYHCKKRTHRVSVGKSSPEDDIYDVIEFDMKKTLFSPLSMVKVRYVKIYLEIELNSITREACIEFTPNTSTLKNYSDDLRIIIEQFIERSGIDALPNLL